MTPDPTPDRALVPAVLLAASLLLALAPTSLGYHLSVGAEDSLGVPDTEPPADTDPELYQRGLGQDCEQPVDEDPTFATQDPFCGALVYHEDTRHEAVSPADQYGQRGVSIDLQMASYVGLYGITTCTPWCDVPAAYDVLHDAGAQLDLLPPSDDVDEEENQAYGGNVYTLSPMQVYAQLGQSWLLPVTDTSFVAFVTDADEQPVGPEALDTLVGNAKGADDLVDRAQAKVCAFSPEAHLGTHAPDAGPCEVELDWIGGDGEGPCQAETYVCGGVQPAWRATTVCPMWHAACYLSDAWNSAHHFAVWHGVVAPSAPASCWAAEPGFDTSSDAMLAHDLDVYEPPSDETPATGVPLAWDEASRNVPGLGELREGRAPAIADTPTGRTVQQSPAFTQHETEPNTDGWLGIEESSQTLEKTRSLDECDELATDEEEADPWVNIVDAHVTRQAAGFGSPAGEEPEPDHDPRPSMRVTGKVGFFTDTDDDADYEQAPASETLTGVEDYGAYPILWDHHGPGDGCEYRGDDTIGDLSAKAGYADPTGLVVTLRLSEGTLVDTRSGATIPVVQPTAVVLLSETLDPEGETVERVIQRAADGRPTIVLEDAFLPQCEEPTGGFTSAWEIQSQPLEGDGVAAAAIVTVEDGAPGGSGAVPASPIELSGTNVWWDLDPFDAEHSP
jgi:hypothetical protein